MKHSNVTRKRVLLVDDHPATRRGLRAVLEEHPDLCVCGEADNAPDAMTMAEKVRPDLALVDVFLRKSHGLELIKNLRASYPRLPTIMYSGHDGRLYGERAFRAGARGYLDKEQPLTEVVGAVRQVLAGESYLNPQLLSFVAFRAMGGKAADTDPVTALSDRELEVFVLIGRGRRTSEIADELGIGLSTVETHLMQIKLKLGCRSRDELIRQAALWTAGKAPSSRCQKCNVGLLSR